MSAKEFYQKVRMDQDAKVIVCVKAKSGSDSRAGSMYGFFNKIRLDDNDRLKIVIE